MSKIVLTDLGKTSDSFIQELTEDELNLLGGGRFGNFLRLLADIADIFLP
jgi:hypothetical protein